MAWHYAFVTATGRLLNEASNLGDLAALAVRPDVSIVTRLARQPSGTTWDEATRTFLPEPAPVVVDRLNDLVAHADFAEFRQVWDTLSTAQHAAVRRMMIKLLGSFRFRVSTESPGLPAEDGP